MRSTLSRLSFSPFLWLCLMGGLAIFSSTMSKNPAFSDAWGRWRVIMLSVGARSAVLGINT